MHTYSESLSFVPSFIIVPGGGGFGGIGVGSFGKTGGGGPAGGGTATGGGGIFGSGGSCLFPNFLWILFSA